MAENIQRRDIELTYWAEATNEDALRSAFRKKWLWVVDSPKSKAVWYSAILSNLNCQYIIPEYATIEVVRNALNNGLSKDVFERLKLITHLSGEELGEAVRISPRTLSRRRTFKPDESERILRVASAFQRTIEVMGDLNKARRWFSNPKRALSEKTPLEYCDTELGAEEVKHLLGRIEHGVFT